MSSEGETRDFMSVDSFSQLPFIRTTPAREKTTTTSSSAIRLFGIEVPQDPANHARKESSTTTTTTTDSVNANTNGSSERGRKKFECHYCCRNFPTSQALGGHQNAHKRERQHAKRAQFQSAIAHHHHHHHQASYSLLNYHRALGDAVSSPPSAHYYPSWINSTSTTSSSSPQIARFYGGAPGSMSGPINGSPLPAWRANPQAPVHGGVALIQRDLMMPLPSRLAMGVGGHAVLGTTTSYYGSSSSSSPSVQATVKDSLSLDLHL